MLEIIIFIGTCVSDPNCAPVLLPHLRQSALPPSLLHRNLSFQRCTGIAALAAACLSSACLDVDVARGASQRQATRFRLA